jgi:hypothetical protein
MYLVTENPFSRWCLTSEGIYSSEQRPCSHSFPQLLTAGNQSPQLYLIREEPGHCVANHMRILYCWFSVPDESDNRGTKLQTTES